MSRAPKTTAKRRSAPITAGDRWSLENPLADSRLGPLGGRARADPTDGRPHRYCEQGDRKTGNVRARVDGVQYAHESEGHHADGAAESDDLPDAHSDQVQPQRTSAIRTKGTDPHTEVEAKGRHLLDGVRFGASKHRGLTAGRGAQTSNERDNAEHARDPINAAARLCARPESRGSPCGRGTPFEPANQAPTDNRE